MPALVIRVRSSCGIVSLFLLILFFQTERMDRQEKLLLDTISALNRVSTVQEQQQGVDGGSGLSAAQREAVVQQMRNEMRVEIQVRPSTRQECVHPVSWAGKGRRVNCLNVL